MRHRRQTTTVPSEPRSLGARWPPDRITPTSHQITVQKSHFAKSALFLLTGTTLHVVEQLEHCRTSHLRPARLRDQRPLPKEYHQFGCRPVLKRKPCAAQDPRNQANYGSHQILASSSRRPSTLGPAGSDSVGRSFDGSTIQQELRLNIFSEGRKSRACVLSLE
jgi:hypothetical protein